MNKRIDLSNIGGFPATQATLAFMQESYREALKSVAKLCGDKTIISGVVVNAGVVSDGWISFNGELIPFVGGLLAAGLVVQETATQVQFQDGANRDAYFTKVAFCGSPATFQFSALRRLNTLSEIWLPGDVKTVDCNTQYIIDNFEANGLGKNERLGWAICNGQNGTNNRGGRVSIGYSSVTIDPYDNVWDVIYNTIGSTGGEKLHKLTVPELAPHNHNIKGANANWISGSPDGKLIDPAGKSGIGVTEIAGENQSHENRPPFIVSLFIQKL